MAGETPGASNANKRRKLAWNSDRSTNKIYASGNISALGDQQTSADSTLKPGQTPVARANTTTLHPDDKSSDKYYANGGSSRVRFGSVAGQKRTPAPQAPQIARQLQIRNAGEISAALEAAVQRVRNGQETVVVYVSAGDSQLLRRTRTSLEMLVTREEISEEQSRSIRLSYFPTKASPVPVPTSTIRSEDNEKVTVDPLAFLDAPEDDTPVISVAAVPVTEVDTSNDPPATPVAAEATPDDDDDDDDTDFVPPVPQASAEDTVPAVEPESEEASAEEAEEPSRRRKRRGN